MPALVVASHDDADPGPSLRDVAEAYARAPAAGAADQRGGGRVAAGLAGRKLSREIAAFCAELGR